MKELSLAARIDLRFKKEKTLLQDEEIMRKVECAGLIGRWKFVRGTLVPEWTDEMCQILGLESGEQVPGYSDLKKYIHPDDWEMFHLAITRSVEKTTSFNLKFRIIKPNGDIRYVHSIGEPAEKINGVGCELVGTLEDITLRKVAEEASQTSRKNYRDLFENFRDVIVVANTDRIIIDCNQAVVDVFGYEKAELLGHKTVYLYESEQQYEELGKVLRNHYGEKKLAHTVNYRKKSGEVFPGETSLFYLENPAGEVSGFIGLIRDVTERLDGERRLRNSEARFRSMVENLFDAVVVINTDGVIQFANHAAEKLFGRDREELVGNPFGFPISFETTYEIDIVQKSGITNYAEIKVSPAEWGDKPVYLASIRDTTDKVEARLEREKHQENLQQLQRIEAIGTLAGGIAHDFNNILTPILGFTELAKDRSRDDEITTECLDEVYQSAARARDLVGQILAFSRQGKETYKPILVEPIIREVLKLIRSAIPTSIAIHQDIQSRGMIIGDETEIHQILMNLCTNAKHAMEKAGGELHISLRDLKITDTEETVHPDLHPGRYLHLQVRDNGCGMERRVLEKIFEPYFTTKEEGKGTGLGLSVVHGIVHNHGGVINVDSMPNVGTTFDIYLPKSATKKETRFEAEADIEEGHERILVVDDEPQVLKFNARMLESLGYQVTARVNGIEALQLFEARSEEFDLLLTDMTMPGMSGDVLADKCIAIKPDLSVIIATGFSEKMTEEKAERMGIKAFLLKPVTKAQMARTLRSALQETGKDVEENVNAN